MAQLAADYPHWIGVETDVAQRAAILFSLFSDPRHLTWEVWKGNAIVGLIVLTDIKPTSDAILHFCFFDRVLIDKTRLLRRFLAYCFEDLRFRRISVQVPVFMGTLVSYYRRKLHFEYEGERAAKQHPTVAQMRKRSPGEEVHVWLASVGSRRERAHWFEGKWHDVLCLRLEAPASSEGDPACLGSQPSSRSSVPPLGTP